MKHNSIQLLLTIAGCGLLAGCGQTTNDIAEATIKSVAIVNLDAVAVRMGRDQQMSQAIQEKELELKEQLETEQATLQNQISEKKSEIGDDPTEQQQSELQALQLESNRKFLVSKQQAQNELVQQRAQLIGEFRAEIQPAINRVAERRGITLVLSKNDALVLAFAPQIDITDAVADDMTQDDVPKDDVPKDDLTLDGVTLEGVPDPQE